MPGSHVCLCSIDDWFYRAAGSIQAERILIRYWYRHGVYSFFVSIPFGVFCLVGGTADVLRPCFVCQQVR